MRIEIRCLYVLHKQQHGQVKSACQQSPLQTANSCRRRLPQAGQFVFSSLLMLMCSRWHARTRWMAEADTYLRVHVDADLHARSLHNLASRQLCFQVPGSNRDMKQKTRSSVVPVEATLSVARTTQQVKASMHQIQVSCLRGLALYYTRLRPLAMPVSWITWSYCFGASFLVDVWDNSCCPSCSSCVACTDDLMLHDEGRWMMTGT